MSYENPQIPEGINADTRSPLGEFAKLSLMAMGILLVLTVTAVLLGGFLGRNMPFSWERGIADATLDLPVDDAAVERALQDLADRVGAEMDLPDGMTVTVHYVDAPVVNAAATLGGHVIVFRGLLAQMPHENALAMLLGHEIAHVRNRDVAGNIGSGAMLSALAAAVTGRSSGLVDAVTGNTSRLVLLRFGRDAEEAADAAGLEAVRRLYGHVGGVQDLYWALSASIGSADAELPVFLRTHPLTEERQDGIVARAAARGWSSTGALTPLPPALVVAAPEAAPAGD